MKKFLLFLVLLSLCLVVTSCDEEQIHSHQLTGSWVSDETQHWHTCSGCEEKFDVASHLFGEWETTKHATTVEAGTKERTCEVCSYVETETIPQLEHEHEETNWQSNKDYHWKGCTGCAEKFSKEAHNYGEWEIINDSTETEVGLKQRTCSVCYFVESEEIALKEHTHNPSNDWVTNDTHHFKTCSGCEEQLYYEEHELVPNVAGSTVTYKCDTCGKEVAEDEEYYLVGYLVDKDWANYEKFTIFARRNANDITIRIISENNVFLTPGRVSQVELYIITGDNLGRREGNIGLTQIIIASSGNVTVSNFGGKSLNVNDITVSVEGKNSTLIDVVVPYEFIGANSEDIFGISCGLWSTDNSDWAPMTSLVSSDLAAVEDLTKYVRCDKDNLFFESPINDYKENIVVPEYNKEELIADRPFGVADPFYVFDENADDIYFKVIKNETSFTFDMVGFGNFEAHEHMKLIIHTSSEDKTGWLLDASDVVFLISSTKATVKSGLANFWDYSDFGAEDPSAMNAPVYNLDEKGYFTLSFTVEFEEIPGYNPNNEIKFIMLEFWNANIYNGDPVTHAMTNKGVGVGDPANQSSYQVLQEKKLEVNKEELLATYKYQFSTNYYANISKDENGLKLSLISFEALQDNHFIRLVVDTDGVAVDGGWNLNANDVSFTINSNKAYISTGNTWFWDNETTQFHTGDETLYTPEYVNHGEYWTIELEIDYSELGLNIDQNTSLKGILIAFTPGILGWGNIFNGEAIDPANQNHYFEFK